MSVYKDEQSPIVKSIQRSGYRFFKIWDKYYPRLKSDIDTDRGYPHKLTITSLPPEETLVKIYDTQQKKYHYLLPVSAPDVKNKYVDEPKANGQIEEITDAQYKALYDANTIHTLPT